MNGKQMQRIAGALVAAMLGPCGLAATGTDRIAGIQKEASFGSSVMTCDGKTLSVGTGKVQREWSWTRRGWQTVRVSHLESGTDWPLVSGAESADWDVPGTSDDAVLVSVSARQSDDEGFTSPHLEVVSTVRYEQSGMEVQHVIWAYPDAPGLRTQLRLKRTEAFSGEGAGRANAFEVLQGKAFTPPAAKKESSLPAAFASTLAAPRELKIKLSGFDPAEPASVGFSWIDWGGGGRVQTVVLGSVDGEAQEVVLDRRRLPGWKRRGEQPAQFVVPVDPTLYPDGTVTMTIRAEAVASACLSELWIYKKGAERDQTGGVPQYRLADILARAPEGAKLAAYMDCGAETAKKDAAVEEPGVADGLPLALSGVDLAAVGYYSDTQNRNRLETELLKEEPLSGAAGENDWASVLAAAAGDERLVLVKESHKCVNTPHGGANTGGFAWGGQGVRVTGLGWTMDAVRDDRYYGCWPTWMVLSRGSEDRMALDIKIMDRMRYPIDPQHDMYIMANTWGSAAEKRDSQIAAREDNILTEIESQADLGIDVQQIDDGWQGFDYDDWRPVPGNTLRPQDEAYSIYQSDTCPVYPNGWKKVRDTAAAKGMVLGLWAAWKISAADLIWNFDNGGFRYFKLDFANLKTMEDYDGLMGKARELILHSKHTARINWDVTEKAPRVGYFSGREYGSIYLENRKPVQPAKAVYTPYLVLRDAWHVSRYLNLNKFQVTVQNNARVDRQASDAYLYPYDYTVAQTLMGSPIFFQETRHYSDDAREQIRPLLAVYRQHRAAMYQGYVFPIGDKPDNKSWSGFQCYMPGEPQGYLTVFRQLENPDATHAMPLKFLEAGTRLKLTDLMSGGSRELTLGAGGTAELTIDRAAGFKFLKYEVLGR